MGKLVVAGLSARLMAEAAVRDGYTPIALDAFGDADTHRAASQWIAIGAASEPRLDAQRTLAALQQLSRRDDVVGWVAGSGFEAQLDLLQAGAQTLPLLGTPPEAVRHVRDPHAFFAFLAVQGVPHPEVRYSPPHPAAGWLFKRADGAGGTHIREARDCEVLQGTPAGGYYQRRMAGTPMSALFIGNGHAACVLGFHELIVRSFGAHPYVYCGAIGPLALQPALQAQLRDVVNRLTAEFGLLGLCSLDFLRSGQSDYAVLEVNPRPSASMALHAHLPLMRWHLQACQQQELPHPPTATTQLRGHEIVFAPRELHVDARQATALAQHPGAHDLPHGATRFSAGEPLCSVSATGPDLAAVRSRLAQQYEAVLAIAFEPPVKEPLHEHADSRLPCAG